MTGVSEREPASCGSWPRATGRGHALDPDRANAGHRRSTRRFRGHDPREWATGSGSRLESRATAICAHFAPASSIPEKLGIAGDNGLT